MEVLRDFAPSEPRNPPSTLAAPAAFVPAAAASTRRVLLSGLSSTNPLPPLTVRLLHGRLLRLDLLADLSQGLLRALSSSGLHLHALALHSLFPDPSHLTLPFALKSASHLPNPLPVGEQLHARSLKLPSHSNPHVLTSLLNLYAKCGLLDHARVVFDEMRCPDIVSWNALIAAYLNGGRDKEAVATGRDAFASGMRPDRYTAVCVLTACARATDLDTGEIVWRAAERERIADDVSVATAAIDLYVKCGEMAKAREVFDKMPEKDAVAWCAMIGGYTSNGRTRDALELFFAMQTQGLRPDRYAVVGALSACTQLGALDLGRQAAGVLDWDEFLDYPVLGAALIDMYAKCGSTWDAWFVFQQMRKRDINVWNTMILGLGMTGHGKAAFALVGQMKKSGMKLNKMTYMSLPCSSTHNSAKTTHSASANSPQHNKRPHKTLLSDSPQQRSVDMDGASMAAAPESTNTSPAPNSSGGSGGIRVENRNVFKSRLYEYAHKAGLMNPKYQTLKEGPSHEPIFKSTVLINNVKYESLPGFFSWRAAEQSAAEVALMEIGKSVALPTNASIPAVQETGMCKNLLQQYAQKMNYALPSYICNKQASGVGHFICTVEIGGIQYIGATSCTEKEAEIKAARTALLAIQGQSEGCANGNTKYIVVPEKRQGKETEKKAIETREPPKAKKGGFKNQWNQKKFIKKNGEAVDVEKDEARVTGETHHLDVHMEPAETIQDPSIDTVMVQPDEGDGRVKHEPTSDTAILQSDGEGIKVEQESPSGVRPFGGRVPLSSVFEKFKILISKIQNIGKNV